MHRARTSSRITVALTLALLASTTQAAITVGTQDGWNLTVGGFVNAFLVSESGDVGPHADLYSRPNKDSTMRVRTGFLPGLLGFTVAAPEVEGIKTGARVGLYPQINGNAGGRTTISGANIDVRELNFTFEGTFGQVLMGRALTLFEAKNVLNDMSLFGVGHPSPTAFDNGPTLGHVGTGYTYPSFDAQIRYTSPDLSGARLALAVVDPASPADGAVLKTPSFEAELSYGGKSGGTSYAAWVSGIYQSSKVGTQDVTSSGVAGGVTAGFSGLDLLASGMTGAGLGTTGVINSADVLDGAGKARTTSSFMGQATYTTGKVKLGVNYSQLVLTRTADDKAGSGTILDGRQAFTGGVWYDLVPSVKLVAEYTHLQVKFTDATKQDSDTFAVGGFLFF